MEKNVVLSDGDKLKEIRKKYGLKQEEITGNEITRNLISEIENDKAAITKKTAEVIIKNLTVLAKKRNFKVTETVDYLMENQVMQATKVFDNYIKELEALSIAKDNSFIKTLKDAEGFFIDWDIKDKKLRIYELAGDYYCNNNEMYKSAVYYEKASALLSRMFLDKELISLSRKLSMVYGYIGDYKKSIECCEFVLSRFDNISLKDKVIFRYNNALNYFYIGNFQKSLNNIAIAENIVDKSDSMYIKILNNKASCLYEINEKHESLKVFNEISKLIDKNSLEDYLINLTNIIHVCLELNLKDEAMSDFDIVINQLVNLNKNDLCISNIYFEIGKIYKELDKLNLSETYYLKALNFSQEQKNYVLANEILNNLLDMYIIENNVEKMNNLKERVFLIAVKKGKIDNMLMYKLIGFYDKVSNSVCTEISNFALKF